MENTFENAVNVLKIQAETSENNAPIWRQEGNLAQAEMGERTAKSCRAAIEQLSQGEGIGIGGGSGDISNGGGSSCIQQVADPERPNL